MRASAVIAFLLSTATALPAAAAAKLVYRVDQATAVIDGNHLIVTAKGAVRSGGWQHPRLILRESRSEPGNLEVEFQAIPPKDRAVVIQTLVPVKVSIRTRLPASEIAAVRVVSLTNSVTAEIIPEFELQRTAKR